MSVLRYEMVIFGILLLVMGFVLDDAREQELTSGILSRRSDPISWLWIPDG